LKHEGPRAVFLLFLLFLQEIISERLLLAAGILDRRPRSGEKNSGKTPYVGPPVCSSRKVQDTWVHGCAGRQVGKEQS
jgi:hypothetical protein